MSSPRSSGSADIFGTFLRKEPEELGLPQFLALISILAALNKKQDQTISVEVLLKQTALSSVELTNLLTMMAKWGISSFGPSEDVRLTQLGKSIFGSVKEMVS